MENRPFIVPESGDPSVVHQYFPPLRLSLFCCHYWWLAEWNYTGLSCPYWRIYWNDTPGAFVSFAKQQYALDPDRFTLIAPNTPVSGQFHETASCSAKEGYCVIGGPANERQEENPPNSARQRILHFFAHFALAPPYNQVSSRVLQIPIAPQKTVRMATLAETFGGKKEVISLQTTLQVYALITDLLTYLPGDAWSSAPNDMRIPQYPCPGGAVSYA
jgi:hypothetical protein